MLLRNLGDPSSSSIQQVYFFGRFVRLNEKFFLHRLCCKLPIRCRIRRPPGGGARIRRESADGSAGSGPSDNGRRRTVSFLEEFRWRRREIYAIAEVVHWLRAQLFHGRCGFVAGRTEAGPAAVCERNRLVATRRSAYWN